MSETALPVSTPAAEAVDPAGISALLAALEAAPDIEPHSLLLLRHGRQIAAGWWSPYTHERRQLLYSLSKSFTATAAGIAVDEGLFDLDDRVIDLFPGFDGSPALLVRHLAAMATGHLTDTWNDVRTAKDPVRAFLRLPPEQAPGSVFAYNQSATYTLAAIGQRRSGEALSSYLRPRLFDPLGIGPVGWQTDHTGREIGFSGLYADTGAIARLGQLYLQRGLWNGRRVLSEAFVAAATRPQIDNPAEPNPDWRAGYGFQFWMSRHGYRGDGAFGQFCLVLPEQDAVLALTSATEDMQSVLDAVWQHLLPAFDRAGSDADALAGRLSSLALPPLPGSTSGPTATFAAADGSEVASLTAVEVADAELVLHEAGGDLRLPFGAGWTVAESAAVAVTGGWTDTATATFDLQFLETPHRLRISCSTTTGTFTARWGTAPLHGVALRDLRSP